MKKLLLILICLFVSFEVRSESDDLSGIKILCDKIKKRQWVLSWMVFNWLEFSTNPLQILVF